MLVIVRLPKTISLTTPPPAPPPPPPQLLPPEPPPPPRVVEVLNIVSNDVEVTEELEIMDTEADEQTIIDVAPVITDIGGHDGEMITWFH